MTGIVPRAGSTGIASEVVARPRRPSRVALLTLLTASVYGFWWWWDLNRQLRALGQPARPGRALAAVAACWTVLLPPLWAGWPWAVVALSVVPVACCLFSVHETAGLLVALQRSRRVSSAFSASVAVGLAAVALLGAVAWFALSFSAAEAGFLVGVAWPLVALALVVYVQTAFNRCVR